MKILIRKSTSDDLDFLEELEISCFPKFQQSTRRVIRYSISSPFQRVFVAEFNNNKTIVKAGSVTLFPYAKTLRLFSIAVLPGLQGNGIGKQMMDYVLQFAKKYKFERISLEVLQSDKTLIQFYKYFGFKGIGRKCI